MKRYDTGRVLRSPLKYALSLVLLLPMASLAQTQGTLSSGPSDPPLPMNGIWQGPFDETVGSGNLFNETWVASGAGQVQITDIYVPGDNYNVYVNGVLEASTSVADWSSYEADAFTSPPYTGDPATAWLDPHFAHVDLPVVAGDVITISDTPPSGYSDGTYAIRGVVPDSGPGVLGVLAIGALLVLGTRARVWA